MSTRNKERPTPSTVMVQSIRQQDIAFVRDSWARAAAEYTVSRNPDRIRSEVDRVIRQRMDSILKRAQVFVATDSARPTYLYGVIAFEVIGDAFVAHWVYTRHHERRQGIARLLLAAALSTAKASRLLTTHETYVAAKAAELGFKLIDLNDLEPYRSPKCA